MKRGTWISSHRRGGADQKEIFAGNFGDGVFMKSALRNPARGARSIDILLGLGLTLLVTFLFFSPWKIFETAQYKIYDLSLKLRGSLSPPKGVAIVAIDDPSVAQVGRWPWPRAKFAELIRRLSEAGTELIALDIVFLPDEAERAAGNDRLLGEATKRAGNVLYPFYFTMGKVKGGEKEAEAPPEILNAALLLFDDPKKFFDFPPPAAREVFAPAPEICQGAKGLGHINILPDPDGKVRWEPLIVEHAGQYFPSFSLQIAASALKLSRGEITVRVGQSIHLGKRKIPTNPQAMMLLHYYGGNQTFPYYSFADVLSGKASTKKFKGDIVLVGVTAAGISSGAQDFMATPFADRLPGVEKHAHAVASILQGHFIFRPSWVPFAEFGLILLVGLLLSLLLPRLRPPWQLVFSLTILLALGALMMGAVFQGVWFKVFFPGLLVILQYVLATARRTPVVQKEPVLEIGYTGIPDKGQGPLLEAEPTVGREVGGVAQKIGRYEILRELGHGAMGVVFKGRDPIIDRLVAIKTIRFDRLYEEQEVQSLQERFFKEAQAAGKFTHPNIVTIFDVGEERGLSYMAMEYVEGESLSKYASKDHLLPLEEVLGIISEVAEALDFAHQRGIVHRDIKPANIMRTSSGQVKVMDFGIAKLPSSTLTQSGSILGTPSYMSPEQINGRAIDGRSDLFSLGCILYELLTGVKPFSGENLSALMYQITQGVPAPASIQNPAIPSACDKILSKALAKNPRDRFQRGKEMAGALKKLLRDISSEFRVRSSEQK
ncbi:MAG: CHASE2 domain-containing protein [Deltaproteobacteria bacterium]|nr:CHASE2 domain-containing protein [Deltaproteobacteria bacterium]